MPSGCSIISSGISLLGNAPTRSPLSSIPLTVPITMSWICSGVMPACTALIRLVSASYTLMLASCCLIAMSCASIDLATFCNIPCNWSSSWPIASSCCCAACNAGSSSASLSSLGSIVLANRLAISCAPGQSMFLTNKSPATCHSCGLPCNNWLMASSDS